MKKKIYAVPAILLVTFLVFSSAAETTARTFEKTVQELTQKAELIVTGKVVEKHSEWNHDRTRIYTKVTVSVDQYLKGKQDEKNVTVTKLGGEVGDVGELYSGTARFKKDEEVVLFLKKDKKGNLRVAGMNKGKFSIKSDRVSGKKMVSKIHSLDEFKTRVKQFLKQQHLK